MGAVRGDDDRADATNVLLKRSEEMTPERLFTHPANNHQGSGGDREDRVDRDEEHDYSLKGCHFSRPAEVYVM